MLKERLFELLTTLVPRIATELACNLHREFNFDVVASGGLKFSHLLNVSHSEDKALKLNWFDNSAKKSILFIAPLDEPVDRWLAKAIYESRKGATVVGILPVSADKEYFHKYIQNIAAEVRFIRVLKSDILRRAVSKDPIAVVVFKEFKGSTKFTSARFNGEVTEHLN